MDLTRFGKTFSQRERYKGNFPWRQPGELMSQSVAAARVAGDWGFVLC